jgi:hypothetical protein
MWARAALAGLFGLVGGAALVVLAAILIVTFWFDVYHLTLLDDGARPGLIRLVPMLPSALAVGALAGATVMAWRTSTGRSTHRWSLVLAAALLLDLAWLGLLVS